ncbi:MAG: Nif3-like dinuclear metal center hexameric protein [Chthonomonas sp.]|nr:Nif3-like dinuclear metal center hexameric protein [Chthonomonas sp.]
MITVQHLLEALEQIAPMRFAISSFDNVGLLVGDPQTEVKGVLTTLDLSMASIQAARDHGCNVIVAHHPVIFDPMRRVTTGDYQQRRVREAIRHDITIIACHTNWDAAPGGVNDALADALGLQNRRAFGYGESQRQLKVVTMVPTAKADHLIDALAAAGAGHIGNYDRCAFSVEGRGTFRGNEHSNPAVGEPNRIETVGETRIEMIVAPARQRAVERALLREHPYEEPAYEFVVLADRVEMPMGRVGDLAQPRLASDLLRAHAHLFPTIRAYGIDRPITRVAVVGGAADGDWGNAKLMGAELYITGEVKQHVALEASESGMIIAECGHFWTEHPAMVILADRLREHFADLFLEVFLPPAGEAGRPMDLA